MLKRPSEEQFRIWGNLAWVTETERKRILSLTAIHKKMALKSLGRDITEFKRQEKLKTNLAS